MRSGTKMVGSHMVLYIKRVESNTPARFGFVVAKGVGGAVKRNLVKRRLRAIARELLATRTTPVDVVVRALPGAAEIGWDALRQETLSVVTAALRKAGVS